jgi:hypothetical protein
MGHSNQSGNFWQVEICAIRGTSVRQGSLADRVLEYEKSFTTEDTEYAEGNLTLRNDSFLFSSAAPAPSALSSHPISMPPFTFNAWPVM